jgi:hypothetical protein
MRTTAWLGAAMLLLVAGSAPAQQHHLTAQATGPFVGQGEATTDLDDHLAEFVVSAGVAGVNNHYISSARANSASGLLDLSTAFSLAFGAGDPVQFNPNGIRPLASIQEWVTPTVAGGPGQVQAHLALSRIASFVDDVPGVPYVFFEATLVFGGCRVTVSGNVIAGFGEQDVTPDCPEYLDQTAGGDANGIHVTADAPDSGEEIQLAAHVRYEINNFGFPQAAGIGYQASLFLFGDASTTLSYASPSFQTQAPEPEAAALAAVAVATLAARARRAGG